MKNILKIMSPVFTNQIKPKLCIDCKYYTKDNFFTFSEFGKCLLFPDDEYNTNFLVNGKNKQYYYCSILRSHDHMCGKEGKYHEIKD
jgi:hypothetical protein